MRCNWTNEEDRLRPAGRVRGGHVGGLVSSSAVSSVMRCLEVLLVFHGVLTYYSVRSEQIFILSLFMSCQHTPSLLRGKTASSWASRDRTWRFIVALVLFVSGLSGAIPSRNCSKCVGRWVLGQTCNVPLSLRAVIIIIIIIENGGAQLAI